MHEVHHHTEIDSYTSLASSFLRSFGSFPRRRVGCVSTQNLGHIFSLCNCFAVLFSQPYTPT